MATQNQQNKISKVMREFYAGKLTTHGKEVTDVDQAKAIALSEAGVSKKKKKGAKKAKRKYAKGGKSVSKKVDLFENYEMIPAKVQKVLNKHIDDEEYSDLEQMLSELQPLGYTFEYGLDAVPFALRPIGVEVNELEGYEDYDADEFAKGGSTGYIPKSIMDKINEINSLIKWAEDKDNFVGGYFGGTYYEYLDFEKPIETKNQFVYIEYNHGGGRKSSDRYNVNKKGDFDTNGLAELKYELSRILSAFRRAKKKYEQKGYFGAGGDIGKQNKEMVHSQVKEAKHHSEELSDILKEDKEIEAWVIAKMERATTDLSDVTHYLDGKDKSFAKGGGVGYKIMELKQKSTGFFPNIQPNSETSYYLWETPNSEKVSFIIEARSVYKDVGSHFYVYDKEYKYTGSSNSINGFSDVKPVKITKSYAKGGGVDMESVEEEIRSLKSRIKSLEEINTKEAYEQSNELRRQLSYLQAKYLHIKDLKYATGGGVGVWETIDGEIVKEISKFNGIESILLFSGHFVEVKDNKIIGSDYLKVPNYVVDKINKDLNMNIKYDEGKYANGGGVGDIMVGDKVRPTSGKYSMPKYYGIVKRIFQRGIGEKIKFADVAIYLSDSNTNIYTEEYRVENLEKLSMAEGGGVGVPKKPKYKIGQLVYSYQNKDTKYPINYIKEADDLGIIRYRLSLPNGNSNWINEESIYGDKYANGGGVDRFSDFDLNKEGNFEAIIDGKKYEIIYRDDVSQMYDLFEDGKLINSSKSVREIMKFSNGGGVGDEKYDVTGIRDGKRVVISKKPLTKNEAAELAIEALESDLYFDIRLSPSVYEGGGEVGDDCSCDEGGVYNNPFLKSIFGI